MPTALAAVGAALGRHEDTRSLTQIRASGATHEVGLPSPASALAADAGGLLVGVRGLGLDHRGGTLRVRTSTGFASISPYACCDTPAPFRASSYDSLLAFSRAPGSANTLVPDLALQIPRAEDGGRVYRFRLRSGLRYWTGAPVRAADVRRGLERAAHSNAVYADALGALSGATACPRAKRCDLRAAVETNDRRANGHAASHAPRSRAAARPRPVDLRPLSAGERGAPGNRPIPRRALRARPARRSAPQSLLPRVGATAQPPGLSRPDPVADGPGDVPATSPQCCAGPRTTRPTRPRGANTTRS